MNAWETFDAVLRWQAPLIATQSRTDATRLDPPDLSNGWFREVRFERLKTDARSVILAYHRRYIHHGPGAASWFDLLGEMALRGGLGGVDDAY